MFSPSVVKMSYCKLAIKFFRPYKILDKIGTPTYKLELLANSQVHPVFHVSQLGNAAVTHVLVKWSSLPVEMVVWEDFHVLKSQFPDAAAWGHAASSAGENLYVGTTPREEENNI
jgi:hypothetical protein